ncbi:MAG: excisionase family DNA-binding protein [Candidatus Rokubacteria bacterium]|nr:excisionase family DNA-binding protein [Candidatus Rokubacteria bacterium]
MRQAAEYLAVSYWTVRGWVESGKLSAVRLGERPIRIEGQILIA